MISIDDAKIFEPTLQIIAGKGKVINDLRKAASTADAVYLAGDPDREGEAISAHLAMVLSKPSRYAEEASSEKPSAKELAAAAEEESKKTKNGKGKKAKAKAKEDEEITIPPTDPKKIFRVTFNEITPKAIRAAFEHPRQVDTHSRGCAAGAPCPRSHRGLQDFAAALGQGAPRSVRRDASRPSRCA